MTDETRLGDDVQRLASADNFRDVTGPGYTSSDGSPLRSGVFWRSNELQLIDDDAGTLARLGITAIFDLRTQDAVDAHPDVDVPGADWHHLPVAGIPPEVGLALPDATATVEAMCDIYRAFVTHPGARTSFGTLLSALASSTTPQLFHCTAGKDRTGWTAALLLHVAGVATDVVETDYLLTNERSADTRAKYLGLVAEHLGPDRVPTFEPTLVADLAYLHAGWAQAVASYGSLDGYLRHGLGLDDDLLAALRTRLVG